MQKLTIEIHLNAMLLITAITFILLWCAMYPREWRFRGLADIILGLSLAGMFLISLVQVIKLLMVW